MAGVADAVRDRGIACFGPSRAAAQLEGSKAFAKDVMAAADVPTARAYVCTTPEEAIEAIDAFGPPYVVKDDGLAAGKGVVVTADRTAALAHAATCGRVVIEEFLDGPEVSLFAVTDGVTVLPLQPAQDFKRLGDGDSGPNTGGMGAYSPLPWAAARPGRRRPRARPAADCRRAASPGHPLRRPALRRSRPHQARHPRHRVQRPLRRPRDPGPAGPAAHPAGAGLLLAAATGRLDRHPPLVWDDGFRRHRRGRRRGLPRGAGQRRRDRRRRPRGRAARRVRRAARTASSAPRAVGCCRLVGTGPTLSGGEVGRLRRRGRHLVARRSSSVPTSPARPPPRRRARERRTD